MYTYVQRMKTRNHSNTHFFGMDPNPHRLQDDPNYHPHETNPLRTKTPRSTSGGEMHHIIPLNIAQNYSYFNENTVNANWNLIELSGAPNTRIMTGGPNVYHRLTANTLNHAYYDTRVRRRSLGTLQEAQTAAAAIRNLINRHPLKDPMDCLDNSGIG